MNKTASTNRDLLGSENAKFTIVAATDRPESLTAMLAKTILKAFQTTHADVNLLDLSQLPAGWFSPQAYERRKDPLRPEVQPWMNANGLIIVSPEYNGSYPGVVKHYIDLLPFPEAMSGKAVAFIGIAAGQWGGLNAVNHLQTLFANRGAYLYPEKVLIPGADEVLTSEGISGSIMERVSRLIFGFQEFTEVLLRLKNQRPPKT